MRTPRVPRVTSVRSWATYFARSSSGNAISVSDVDANGGNETVSLSVGHGALTLSGTSGLSFSAGDGTADAAMTFTGTIANINAALNGLVYVPTANFNGNDSVVITTNDLGNTGAGGAKGDNDAVAIFVNPVNDAPVNPVPGAQTSFAKLARRVA